MQFDRTAEWMEDQRNFGIALAAVEAKSKDWKRIAEQLVSRRLYSAKERNEKFVKDRINDAIKAGYLKEEKDRFTLTEKGIQKKKWWEEKGRYMQF